MRFLARIGLASAAVAALATPTLALGQSAAPTLTEATGSSFPDRGYLLQFPSKQALTAAQVNVTENGGPVSGLAVEPPGGSASGAILLIDASKSMQGAPIAGAMAAARAFLAERKSDLPVAVIVFGPDDTVLAEFTTDAKTLASAVAKAPPLAEGTHIYDALIRASELATDEGLERTTVVLLSDGTDVGSEAGRADALAALGEANARVISVGLRSSQYDPATLRAVAQRTGGSYAESATPAALETIFHEIGARLSSEFVITYRSLLPPHVKAVVRATVAGYAPATTTYTTPTLDVTARGTFERDWVDTIIVSPFLMVFIIVSVIALIAFAIITALDVRDRSLRRRMAMYVTVPSEEESRIRRAEVAAMLADQAERRVRSQPWWQSFERDVELGGFNASALTIAGWTVIGGVLASLVVAIAMQSLFGLLVGLLRVRQKRGAFAEQLPDNLEVLAGALRAGHSLVGAMGVMVDGADEPSKTEFRRVLQDEQLGVPLDQALTVMSQRMENRDVDQVAIVTRLQREAGGNTAEVLDRVVENIRGRMEIRRLIRVLTAQGRLARWVLTVMPLALVAFILLLNPNHLDPLFNTQVGRAFLVLWFVMMIAGWYAIKKVIEIDI